jgi:DNA-binding beta-propeller fold protein YncE
MYVIDGNSFSVITHIYIDGFVTDLALTGDGTQLYVVNETDHITVVDAINFYVTGYIPITGGVRRCRHRRSTWPEVYPNPLSHSGRGWG